MHPTHSVRLSTALALGLLAAFVAEDALRFEPEGSLAKSFVETTHWELTSLVELSEGRELPAEEIDFTGSVSRELELIDTYGPIAGGRPERVTRSFERAAKTVEADLVLQGLEELYEVELETPLEGETVRFDWDADEQAFVASSETGLGSLHLERLQEDLDLRGLLPPTAEQGDHWTVPAADLAQLFTPAGRLIFTDSEVPDGPYDALTSVDLAALTFLSIADAAQDIEGQISVAWDETRPDGNLSLAVLELELEAVLAGSVDSELERLVEDMGASGKQDVLLDFEWNLAGHGQLVWNLTEGHFQVLALELEGALELEMTWSAGGGEAGARVGFATRSTLHGNALAE